MKMWIARDLIGVGKGNPPQLTLSEKKPVLRPERVSGVFFIDGFYVQLPEHYFPEVTFENSPMEVELILKKQNYEKERIMDEKGSNRKSAR